MDVRHGTSVPAEADTFVVLLRDGDEPPAPLAAVGARTVFRRVASTAAGATKHVSVGMGAEPSREHVRMAAATAVPRVRELGGRTVVLFAPREHADAAVEGFVMGAYRYRRWKTAEEPDDAAPSALVVVGPPAHAEAVALAAVAARATNAARELQDGPPNEVTPAFLADRARAIAAAGPSLSVDVLGRAGLLERGMGCFAAVAQASTTEPALITLRYEGVESGPVLGLVGKAVTFDSGGLSMKPPGSMPDQKYDMSGGAAVLEALAAIAALALPVRIIGVVGATDNMVSGSALRPGDILRAANGVSVEVTNTDAEGRLVLADCLLHARSAGATHLLDIATLTGGVVTALGRVYAGLMSPDDAWATAVQAAGERAGEPSWRLPLHPDYNKSLESRVADTLNSNLDRKGAASVAAVFLQRFTAGGGPWAHLDIAGVADGRGKPYADKGGAGYGVRTMIELARSFGE